MLKRVITGVLLVAYVLALTIGGLYAPVCIDILILSFTALGVFEIYNSMKKSGFEPFAIPIFLAFVAMYPMIYFYHYKGMITVLFVASVIAMTMFTFKKTELKALLATLFCIIYPMLFLSSAFLLTREIPATFIVLLAVFIPVGSDTFAYFVGSTFGGPKLCPTISPKKTISGAIGGVLGGIIASMLIFVVAEVYSVFDSFFAVPSLGNTLTISGIIYGVIGLVGAVISMLGDLFASRVKRAIGIKDFGNIFPGHGGALDRVDSIMYEIVFLLVVFLILGIL